MSTSEGRHAPVLLAEVLAAIAPRQDGVVIDGTFGAGGYSRALLQAGAGKVIAIDRDPDAIAGGTGLVAEAAGRLVLHHGRFAELDRIARSQGEDGVDGVVLDIGVSSMQIDEAQRGFSFLKDGPLDMRMSKAGRSAADVVAELDADDLADVIYIHGEERQSRAIARAIVKARQDAPITTTLQLVKAIERATGPHRPGMKTHPATRTFQALRIYVNGELEELEEGLRAAERILRAGGRLAVVTFHSLEDRIVKRFLAERSGHTPGGSRHAPEVAPARPATFELIGKGHVGPGEPEIAANPRARSAKLRAARRTAAPCQPTRNREGR
jgi:16S rRNA (cytosine1402-N4)-methyltransferase